MFREITREIKMNKKQYKRELKALKKDYESRIEKLEIIGANEIYYIGARTQYVNAKEVIIKEQIRRERKNMKLQNWREAREEIKESNIFNTDWEENHYYNSEYPHDAQRDIDAFYEHVVPQIKEWVRAEYKDRLYELEYDAKLMAVRMKELECYVEKMICVLHNERE